MGSPEDEPESHQDEGPRHLVTLSQGFWFADTACTQALWKMVMGVNPSQFQGNEQFPVEQVSWMDVQEFLTELMLLLPYCEALLPTEAQWEYACRAGTDTPFSFGLNITPEQVNYNGSYPYAGAKNGPYREKTVPVKSLLPNAWGLYEMHGNVWEWCMDGMRRYQEDAVVDPLGPLQDQSPSAPRALRGGSWGNGAGDARSADRDSFEAGMRYDGVGFRICLRSIEPGLVSDALGRRVKPARGARSP